MKLGPGLKPDPTFMTYARRGLIFDELARWLWHLVFGFGYRFGQITSLPTHCGQTQGIKSPVRSIS